jgi:hypothetical protein
MVKYTHLECIEYTSRIIKSADGKLHNVLTGSDISIKIDANLTLWTEYMTGIYNWKS